MALTEERKDWRRGGIGGSDARTIAGGSGQDWISLKREKIEGVEPEFSIQQRLLMDMGSALEPVILDYVHANVTALGLRDAPVTMPADPYFRCSLDAVTLIGQPVQSKFHTGDKDMDDLEEFYWPQLQHELLVTGEKVLVLAVVFGHWGRFDHRLVQADHKYQSEYMHRALQFKEFCWGNAPLPADLVAGEAPALKPNVPRLRDHVWPAGSNEVAKAATDWLNNREAADAFKAADKDLKALVPDDCRTATWLRDGVGIKITINKAGSKSIKAHVGTK